MKLDSTPVPVFAEASNTERPVLLVNSIISSSVTYLSGISMEVPFLKSVVDFVGLDPDSPATEVLALLFIPVSVADPYFISTKSYLLAITII